MAIECKWNRSCCSSLWVLVWGWVRPRVYFPREQRRILRSAERPAIPPAPSSYPFSGPNLTIQICSDLGNWAYSVCNALLHARDCIPFLEEGAGIPRTFICTRVTSSHTSVSSLCPVASDFVTHWVFKKNLFLLHISKQTDKIAFRLWSVLYRGRRECSRSSSSRYQLQISRKELLSN